MTDALLWHRIQFAFTANTATQQYGLQVVRVWWTFGITLAVAYSVYLFRSIRGKVDAGSEY